MRRSLWTVFGVALPVAVIAFAGFSSVTNAQEKKDEKKPEAKKADEPKKAEGKDIVQTATDAGTFKTLTELLKDADLVDTLKGKGPFTVLAPTDDAFAKVDKTKLDALKKDKAALKKLLLGHVVEGSHDAAGVGGMKDVTTKSGAKFAVKKDGTTIWIGVAKVTKADVKATNGLIHVIDTVLMEEAHAPKAAEPKPAAKG